MCNNNVYVINSRGLAESIRYLGQIQYKKEVNKYDNTKFVYVFENNERFREILTKVNNLKSELN